MMKRISFWILGFALLFMLNAVVETLVLPGFGLDNTERNDLYFQCWWMAVVVWLLFGNIILHPFIEARRRERVRV